MPFATALAPILPAISTGVAILGTAVSAFSAYSAAQYQAQIAERNAKLNEENALRANEAAASQQLQSDQIARALLGEQRAAQSASGLALGGRSQMLTRKSAARLARIDAQNIKEAGAIDAYNFRVAAQDATSQATFSRMQGNNALLEGFLSGAGTLVGGFQNYVKPTGSVLGRVKPPARKLLRFA